MKKIVDGYLFQTKFLIIIKQLGYDIAIKLFVGD